MLSVRSECVSESNEYLFANPRTENRWLSGYHVLKKLAQESGVSNKDLFTSTRLRKQIATVLQVMNIGETEMEQFANFMGHTRKTHEEYYRLPQDVFQTAKVSKILIAINNGKGAQYKGKSLDEIEFSDNVDSDDSDVEDGTQNTGVCLTSKTRINNNSKDIPNSSRTSNDIPGPSKPYNNSILGQSVSEAQIAYIDESDLNSRKDDIQRMKTTNIRKPWTKKQTDVIREFFAKHIKEKIAPKKARG
ncbi:hypothetical protein NQ318_004937 [Aromia moschata]|uniref:Uncharacterized protein n=1 Tax=Aromia moschata TaxID=1265417 RepID=A0AAV8Z216_9CUCU|nr:hypothetical protein NQ318_004937 [Aromia moschata]